MTAMPSDEPVSQIDIDAQRGQELRNSEVFDFNRWSIYPEFDQLVGNVLAGSPGCTRKDFNFLKVLLANLYDLERRFPEKYLQVSKDKGFYSRLPRRYNPVPLGYRSAARTIDALVSAGYLLLVPGMYDRIRMTGYQTRLKATPRLAQQFLPLRHIRDLIGDHRHTETIRLRERKSKNHAKTAKLIDYVETSETQDMRYRLGVINVALAQHEIVLHDEPDSPRIYKRKLYRIFNNGVFEDGGRFYGGCWQQLNEEERSRILINGSFTEELDFKGLHIRMLYALEGIDIGDDDPYRIPGLDESYRDLFKVAVLILINAAGRRPTIEAIRNEVRTKFPEFNGNLVELIDRFVDHHRLISRYFFSGYGVKLQRIDSDILEDILYNLSIRGIPALPVHDSVVVPVGNREIVELEMNRAYEARLGFSPRIDYSELWIHQSRLYRLFH